MSGGNKRSLHEFMDTFAIYYSRENGYWIAHSLRTDRVGKGDCIVNALVDGLRAVKQVVDQTRRKRGTQVFRPAPDDVQEIAQTAEKLPDEIYQRALKMYHGAPMPDLEVTSVEPLGPCFFCKVRQVVLA